MVRRDLWTALTIWLLATLVLSAALWQSAIYPRPPVGVLFLWISAQTLSWLAIALALLVLLPRAHSLSVPQLAALHAAGAAAAILLQPVLQSLGMRFLGDVLGLPRIFGPIPTLEVMIFGKWRMNVATYAALALLLQILISARHARAREAGVRAAELRSLQGRLQPHFLLNSIHSVVTLIDHDREAAKETLQRLADLLRITLQAKADQPVTLREELEWARAYLAVERVRFADRLRVHYEIADEVLSARVPPLILQPLVENAIRHGIAASEEGGTLLIRASGNGEETRIEVETRLLSPATAPAQGFGIGLEATRSRLNILYPSRAAFALDLEPTRSLVTLVLPA